MIRTNSKQARQNVQAYIMEHFDGCNYEIETPATFQETAAVVSPFSAVKSPQRAAIPECQRVSGSQTGQRVCPPSLTPATITTAAPLMTWAQSLRKPQRKKPGTVKPRPKRF